MSNVLKVQVQDEAGNIYYLHTSADIVFCEDGTSVEEKLKTGATQTVMGMLSAADKKKLDGVAENANNYTHPSTHPASMITQDSTHRFATDTEKTAWNAAKQGAIDAIKALMSNSQTNNTGKIPTSALVYAMNQTLSGLNSKLVEEVLFNATGVVVKNDDGGFRVVMGDGTSFRFHANNGTAWVHKFDASGAVTHAWTFHGSGDFSVSGDIKSSAGITLNSLIPATSSVTLKSGFTKLNVNRIDKSGMSVFVNAMVTITSRIPKDQDTVLGTIPAAYCPMAEVAGNFVTTTGIAVNTSVFANGEIHLYPKEEIPAGQVFAINYAYAIKHSVA